MKARIHAAFFCEAQCVCVCGRVYFISFATGPPPRVSRVRIEVEVLFVCAGPFKV